MLESELTLFPHCAICTQLVNSRLYILGIFLENNLQCVLNTKNLISRNSYKEVVTAQCGKMNSHPKEISSNQLLVTSLL